MKNQKIAAALLALLAVSLPVLSACGSSQDDSSVSKGAEQTSAMKETETSAVETEEMILRADLPDMDWEGRQFRVLGQDTQVHLQFRNFEIYAEAENADPVNDAVFRRNMAIQEKYNVEIRQFLFEDYFGELKKVITAGEDLYDLAFLALQPGGTAIQNGYFYDLYTVDYIDFSKPWWNPEVNEAVSVGNRLFMSTSDFALRDKNRAYILFYNADLADQYDIPDMVQTVRDGKWTMELMTQYNKLLGNDANGDGKMDLEDTYGLVMDSYNAFPAFVIGGGNRMVTKDADDQMVIAMNTQRMIDTVDRVLELCCDRNTAFFCEDYQVEMPNEAFWSASGISFNGGKALFSMAFPHSLKGMSAKAEFNYGVLPMPKFDEEQEKYYTLSDIYGMLFGIPKTMSDPDFSGFMLEALSAASTNTSLKAFYDVSCKTKYAVNEETGEMLDLIFDGIVYDPAAIYGKIGLYNIFTEVAGKRQNAFASLYKKKEKSANKRIAKITETIAEIE